MDEELPISQGYRVRFTGLSKFLHLDALCGIIDFPAERFSFTSSDVLIMFFIAFFSYFTRLRNFQYPANIVFDEVHFGNFTNFYINNQYFFDIHPPLVKLTFALFGWLSEYAGDIYFGEEVSEPYPDEGYIPLRITPIMFSSLTPCFIYMAVRFACFSKCAAFIAAFMWCCDTSALCEGKFLLTDGSLHFWTAFSMVIVNYWLQFEPGTKEYNTWKYLASLACGIAYTCKYTAMSMWIVMCFPLFCQLLIKWNYTLNDTSYSEICKTLWSALWPGGIFHIAMWVLHIVMIPYIGPDSGRDSEEREKGNEWLFPLTNRSNETEASNMVWTVTWPPILIRVIGTVLTIQMSNAMNYEPHPYMSRPIDWPLLTDMYVGFFSHDYRREINCIGNPFVYYMGFFGVLACVAAFLKPGWIRVARFLVAYFCSYLPFFLVPRTMFLYHYLIPLMFACMCCGIAVDMWVPKKWRGLAVVIIALLVFYGFREFSPLVYGDEIEDCSDRIWNDAWTSGRKGREKYVSKMQKKFDDLDKAEKEEKASLKAAREAKSKAKMMKNVTK